MVLTAIAGVLAGVLLFVLVLRLAASGTAKTNLAPPVFRVGPARVLAQTVQRHGPLLFPDPTGRSRDIYLQHLEGRWTAFAARPRGAPRRCTLRWEAAARQFVDPCGGPAFPPDGAGLTAYGASVDAKGVLVVDLRQPAAPSTTVG